MSFIAVNATQYVTKSELTASLIKTLNKIILKLTE